MRWWTPRTRRWTAVLFAAMPGVFGSPRVARAQRRVEPAAGMRFGPPLRVSMVAGVTYGDSSAVAEFEGPMVLGELGLGGGRLSAGYLFAGPFVTGMEMYATVVRTWWWPAQVDPNRTLAGGEVRVFVFGVNVGVGVYRPVSGFGSDRKARYFFNAGLGL